jgi:hypothetical protein
VIAYIVFIPFVFGFFPVKNLVVVVFFRNLKNRKAKQASYFMELGFIVSKKAKSFISATGHKIIPFLAAFPLWRNPPTDIRGHDL